MAKYSQASPRVERVKHPIVLPASAKAGGLDLHAKDLKWRQGHSQRVAAKEAAYRLLQRELRRETLWGRLTLWLETKLDQLVNYVHPWNRP